MSNGEGLTEVAGSSQSQFPLQADSQLTFQAGSQAAISVTPAENGQFVLATSPSQNLLTMTRQSSLDSNAQPSSVPKLKMVISSVGITDVQPPRADSESSDVSSPAVTMQVPEPDVRQSVTTIISSPVTMWSRQDTQVTFVCNRLSDSPHPPQGKPSISSEAPHRVRVTPRPPSRPAKSRAVEIGASIGWTGGAVVMASAIAGGKAGAVLGGAIGTFLATPVGGAAGVVAGAIVGGFLGAMGGLIVVGVRGMLNSSRNSLIKRYEQECSEAADDLINNRLQFVDGSSHANSSLTAGERASIRAVLKETARQRVATNIRTSRESGFKLEYSAEKLESELATLAETLAGRLSGTASMVAGMEVSDVYLKPGDLEFLRTGIRQIAAENLFAGYQNWLRAGCVSDDLLPPVATKDDLCEIAKTLLNSMLQARAGLLRNDPLGKARQRADTVGETAFEAIYRSPPQTQKEISKQVLTEKSYVLEQDDPDVQQQDEPAVQEQTEKLTRKLVDFQLAMKEYTVARWNLAGNGGEPPADEFAQDREKLIKAAWSRIKESQQVDRARWFLRADNDLRTAWKCLHSLAQKGIRAEGDAQCSQLSDLARQMILSLPDGDATSGASIPAYAKRCDSSLGALANKLQEQWASELLDETTASKTGLIIKLATPLKCFDYVQKNYQDRPAGFVSLIDSNESSESRRESRIAQGSFVGVPNVAFRPSVYHDALGSARRADSIVHTGLNKLDSHTQNSQGQGGGQQDDAATNRGAANHSQSSEDDSTNSH